jgi:hypothetical protein
LLRLRGWSGEIICLINLFPELAPAQGLAQGLAQVPEPVRPLLGPGAAAELLLLFCDNNHREKTQVKRAATIQL